MADSRSQLHRRPSSSAGRSIAALRRGSAVRRRRGGTAFALVVALAGVLNWGSGVTGSEEPGRPTPAAVPQAHPVRGEFDQPEAVSAPAVPVRSLQGRALATAWLSGYLTRSSRDDDRWESAIADLSTPELVDELREAGPDMVGLDQFSSWRVTRITAFQAVDQPVDTPSRTTLAYTAVVTDGRRSVAKPFLLYAYRQGDNRWLITLVEQPYSSEG